MKKYRYLVVFALLFLLVYATTSQSAQSKIDISPRVKGDYKVQVDISTDLPDGALLNVYLQRHGLQDDDPSVGTEYEDVSVKEGKASVLIDAESTANPSTEWIVQGKYDVVVSFPLNFWQESNLKIGQKLGFSEGDDIKAVKTISLKGNGQPQKVLGQLLQKEKGRRWVMSNVHGGYPWDPVFWSKKFGSWENFDPPTGNPKILRRMYFPSIDMTLLVNIYKNEVATWSPGRSEE
ncbi:hypothetical protein [Prevotella fusca]